MADGRPLADLLGPWSPGGFRGAEPDRAAAAGQVLARAEELLAAGPKADPGREVWDDYLAVTRHPDFLTGLPDMEFRNRWAETTFVLIERLGYTLEDLLRRRATDHPERTLFRELQAPGAEGWNYARVRRRVRATAALFLQDGPRPELAPHLERATDGPRVGLFCANSLGTAICDLACLCHDIFVSPLNIHFTVENLVWIFDRLQLTVAVCDDPDRLDVLLQVREKAVRPFTIYTLNRCRRVGEPGILLLPEQVSRLDAGEVERILAARPRRTIREVATVMFTSGSTGMPKGVAFNQYNLVTKRFARAAALPAVGEGEIMLCYLPLFHTFGRYLEMLGAIFWGGTYLFAGNPSADTLLNQFREERPTALISVPIRWVQIRDRVMDLMRNGSADEDHDDVFRSVVGDRLRWGLSAAGYLDPRVFRFFHRQGVDLCSGFGMTEGTGGLTMTPPDDYVEDSVGRPLPGVKTRFTDEGELEIAGCYIARYLPFEAEPGDLAVADPETDDHWLSTGDLFRTLPGGHLEIVDRIKDIYKNNKGQTIAPRIVESMFDQVPGIKRTFLAGDGRAYNTLLIVPDEEDDVLRSLVNTEDRRNYFQQIVTTANPALASFERVVNFAILDRDFDAAKGELTPKASYKRKAIENNFAEVIADLYQTNVRKLRIAGFEVRIPRWFFRDLGVLEDAITIDGNDLVNRESGRRLTIQAEPGGGVRIGDLGYRLNGRSIDLGRMVRQPLLWLANGQLINFGPCRPGWDTVLGSFAEQVHLPDPLPRAAAAPEPGRLDRQLADVNTLCSRALFGDRESSLLAIVDLDRHLERAGARQGAVIRRRLEALATHPEKQVRCRAYQVLVLDQPVPDYQRYLPAFIESGKPFLDEESFQAISRASIGPRRLQAFRQRLYTYRMHLTWPAPERTRLLFTDIFRLLAGFVRVHPEFYGPIREELVTWALHGADPDLAAAARRELQDLVSGFEAALDRDYPGADRAVWRGKIAFQEGLGSEEVDRLEKILVGTSFLKQSVMLAFEGEDLDLDEIGTGGIWVSRIISRYADSRYRVSINTIGGKHFDLQVIIRQDGDLELVEETIYRYIQLRGYPFGTPMLPSFGCSRPELGALSMAYVSDLTVWEKIREFSSVRGPGTTPPTRMRWHQLMVQAMAVVIRGWRNSGRQIIPGLVMPNNIIVPEPDFRKGAVQNSLSGWRPYEGPLSLVRPLWRNIYQHTISHYPWTSEYLEREWIFEAFVEALGVDEARRWLDDLDAILTEKDAEEMGLGFREALDDFRGDLAETYYQPLALKGAIHRFGEWEIVNPQAPLRARLEIIEELVRLYRLDRMPDIARFHLFRHTYFGRADLGVLDIYDRLLARLFRHPDLHATGMVELSDLQAVLTDPDDLVAFNRLAFPLRQGADRVEVTTVGPPDRSQVVVRSNFEDRYGRRYSVGEAAGPAEVGQMYRLFLKAGYPKTPSKTDRFLVAMDEAEQIIGGVVYHELDEESVFLDGIVVTQALGERGIAAAILQDFCTRLRALDYRTVKTHFFLRRFFQKHGFRIDQRWGGLVRHL